MTQKRFEGMANRTSRIVAAFAVVLMLAGVCGGKVAAQGRSGEPDKALNGKWQFKNIDGYGFVFDNGEFSFFYLDNITDRGTYATSTKNKNGKDIPCISMSWNETYNSETGKWIAKEKPSISEYFYRFMNEYTLVLEDFEGDEFPIENKEKRVAKIAAVANKLAELNTANKLADLKDLPPSPESDFLVEPTDDSFTAVKVTKYKGNDPLVVIPATIQGLPVKWIGACGYYSEGNGLFEYKSNIVAVVIPEGVTYIWDGSFKSCTNLSTVVLPSTLKVIGHRAFENCSKLTSIELPAGLLYIGRGTFVKSGLTSVNLPEGLVVIDTVAFEGTPLTSVSLPKSLRLMGHPYFGTFKDCNSLADIQIPANHAISMTDASYCDAEETFDKFFSGTKIEESIILQKQLKETKTRKISMDEFYSILDDIKKQIGVGFYW